MRRGFTLIEVLVASLLLGLLVSMLTTIFTQTSIAWSTGTALVTNLDNSRRDIAKYQADADVVLDGSGSSIQGVFRGFLGNNLNERAVTKSGGNGLTGVFNNPTGWSGLPAGSSQNESSRPAMGDGNAYVVGVTSDGPDMKPDTWDDITTLPPEGE